MCEFDSGKIQSYVCGSTTTVTTISSLRTSGGTLSGEKRVFTNGNPPGVRQWTEERILIRANVRHEITIENIDIY